MSASSYRKTMGAILGIYHQIYRLPTGGQTGGTVTIKSNSYLETCGYTKGVSAQSDPDGGS